MSTNILPNNNTITLSPGGLGTTNHVYVGGGAGGNIGPAHWSTSNTLTASTSSRIELRGAHADIVINGVSLNDTLRSIQDRLNMLRPNCELEADWDQLRSIGEQYRDLEKQLMEKQRAWDLLRKKEG
jgi:hypothetical protein